MFQYSIVKISCRTAIQNGIVSVRHNVEVTALVHGKTLNIMSNYFVSGLRAWDKCLDLAVLFRN